MDIKKPSILKLFWFDSDQVHLSTYPSYCNNKYDSPRHISVVTLSLSTLSSSFSQDMWTEKAVVVGGNANASRLGKENKYERRPADCGQFWQAFPLSAPVNHGCLQLPMFVLLAGRLQENQQ